MSPAVPTIYTRLQRVPAMRPAARLLAGLIAASCLVTLLVAMWLTPAAQGIGTHRALGLQVCGFLGQTGLPCPSCGMTTSFAHFVRGDWAASFYIQPMGFILALLTGIVFWASLYEMLSGKPIHRLLTALPMRYHLFPLMGLVVIAWAWKIFIHIRGMDGW